MVTIQGCNECEFTLSYQGSPLLKGAHSYVFGEKRLKKFFSTIYNSESLKTQTEGSLVRTYIRPYI